MRERCCRLSADSESARAGRGCAREHRGRRDGCERKAYAARSLAYVRPGRPLLHSPHQPAAQEAVTAGAAHRHRSVLKRRSWRHRGGGRARRAHDKTCVRDGGELGRRWWAENASRYGRAGPRRALRRNRTLRTNRTNRTLDSPSPNTTRGPPPPVSQSENSDCTRRAIRYDTRPDFWSFVFLQGAASGSSAENKKKTNVISSRWVSIALGIPLSEGAQHRGLNFPAVSSRC